MDLVLAYMDRTNHRVSVGLGKELCATAGEVFELRKPTLRIIETWQARRRPIVHGPYT